jgi:hypothetical protein
MEINKIISLLEPLVRNLINKEYDFIYQSGMSGEYTAQEIEDFINEYGGVLTDPPDEDYENIEIYEIDDEPEYVIEYELWVDNEKSDLTLSATIRIEENEETITIDNIHVM